MPPNDPADDVPTDAILVDRIRRGAPEALDPLYRRHGAEVYRFALLWSGSAALAADVTQEVFVHLLVHAGDYDSGRGRLNAYLCGIARNLVRRQRAMPTHDPLPDADDDPRAAEICAEEKDGPLPRLLLKAELESLRLAIARLPAPYREALIMIELQGCSYAEAAAICGCELGTIRSRLSRARGLLVRLLAPSDANATMGATQ